MQEAMQAVWQRPESTTKRYYARDEGSLVGSFRPRENSTLPDRLSFPVLDSRHSRMCAPAVRPISSPETREREAVGRVSSIFSDAGGYSWGQFRAPVAGQYRLRFKGYTIWVSGGGMSRWYYEGFGDEKAPVYYLPLWHRPNLDEVWPGRTNEPMSVFAQSSGQNRMIGEFDFLPEPSESEMTVMLRAGEVVRTDGSRLFRTRVNGTGEQYVNPLATDHGMPGYAIQWMEVEGPLTGPTVRRRIQAAVRRLADEEGRRTASRAWHCSRYRGRGVDRGGFDGPRGHAGADNWRPTQRRRTAPATRIRMARFFVSESDDR